MTTRDRVRGRKPANGITKLSAAIVLVKELRLGIVTDGNLVARRI